MSEIKQMLLLLMIISSIILGMANLSLVDLKEGFANTNIQNTRMGMKDPCASFSCQNEGECRIVEENPTCVCQTGYYGPNCENDVDPCTSLPCENEGVCIREGISFSCHCKPSYYGELCEKDPCTENPCRNGGTCLLTEYSYECQCRYPYSGDTCQYVDACYDNPCFNGGTCEKDGESFKCKCRYGYFGNVCEREGYESTTDSTTKLEDDSISTFEDVGNHTIENYTEPTKYTPQLNLTTIKSGICAVDSDCLNGGVCSHSYCECPPNFNGYFCERNDLCEKLEPTCRVMGASCKTVGLNAICDCPQDKMYHSKTGICEDICDPWKCLHGRCEIDGRTYKCTCDTGYTGHQCRDTIQVKAEKSSVYFSVLISIMVFICFLLIGQMCIFCGNQKYKSPTSEGFFPRSPSILLTTSDA